MASPFGPSSTSERQLARRAFLQTTGWGIGPAAITWLLAQECSAAGPNATQPLRTPTARQVIHLHMVGGPSQLDLFDEKPELKRRSGEPVPESLTRGQRFAFLRGDLRLLGSQSRFGSYGQSGLRLAHHLPHLASVADDLTLIRSLHTEPFNHAPAQLFMHTGFPRFGRPSIGAWLSYGLGTINQNLPTYVVMNSGSIAGGGNSLWGPGFLPSQHQGVEFRSQGDPVLFLSDPEGMQRADRRRVVDSVRFLNKQQYDQVGDPEITTRIEQYELAFQMQTTVPDLIDLSSEPAHILRQYNAKPGEASFANHCLLARRLVENGVRFVQLFDSGWDHHNSIFSTLPRKCKQMDQPVAALIHDLKQRGLLDSTLVLWTSEFGRTPMAQMQNGAGVENKKAGRDHHRNAFCGLLAGGGVRPGVTFGETDEFGYHPVRDPVEVHDLHATVLHLLGIDHEQLTYRFQGRNHRLTDVSGNVLTNLV